MGISVPTLAKAFREELVEGLERVKAAMITTVVKPGIGGDWRAARYWLATHDDAWRVTERREIEQVSSNHLSHLSTEELEARLAELQAAGRPLPAPPKPVDPAQSVH